MITSVEDRRSPQLQWQRKALVYCDVVESVRLMSVHPADVIDRWRRFIDEVRQQLLPARGGRLVKSTGDGLLLEFDLVPSAAAAAIDLQRRIASYNANRATDTALLLRVGVHVCDVVVTEDDDYGPGANLVARLTGVARPGEIVVSADIRDHLVAGVDADVEDLGDCHLKHIDEPVRAFRLGAASGSRPADAHGLQRSEKLRPGLAVIPFECSFGTDPGAVLGEALADDVIAQLAKTAELHVISALSTRTLKGRQLGISEIASHLGAAYVLSGRYRLSAGEIILNVEFADARSQHVLWAERFETSTQAALDPAAPLADRIVAATCRAVLSKELELAVTLPLPALESYTLLFGGISLMHRNSPRDFERARDMLEHLAHRQGRRGVAHAWLAKWHVLRVVQGWSPDRASEVSQALDRARRALDANPHDSLALAIAGQVHGYLRRDLDAAGRYYDDALNVNPNESLAWLFSATRHAYQGESAAAEHAVDMALRLSPLDPLRYYYDSLASTAVLAGSDWQRGVDLALRSIKANRAHASTWRTLAYALVMLDRVDEAKQAVLSLREIEPGYTLTSFRERFPGRDGPMCEPWARALELAGLPP